MKELLNKIHHDDCLEFMKQLPDKCIDLVLTDPPYGIDVIAKTYQNKNTKPGLSLANKTIYDKTNAWDKEPPNQDYFDEIFRISKEQIIFGGNYFDLPPSNCWLVWDKVNYGNDFADCELAWTSFSSAVRKFTFQWNGMLQGDMKNKEARIHPTQKPRQLFSMILEKYAQQNQIILDCFSGSGTTALACHDLGLDFICIEKDADYFAASVERLEQHQRQLRLL